MKLRSLLFTVLSFLMVCSCGKDDDNTGPGNQAPNLITEEVDAPEDTPDQTTFATLEASDPDGDSFIFSLDASEAMFRITATGGLQLKTGQQFNRTTATQHTVNVTVIDENGAETEGAVTINVTEAGEETNEAPVMEDQEFSVDEDVADDFVIATVIAADEDSEDLTFSIKTNSDGKFEMTEDGSISLVDGEELDAWDVASHEIIVSVTDGEHTTDATITIDVNDTRSFITTWQIDTAGETIGFGDLQNEFYECGIKWGDEMDDSYETYVATTPPSHVYEEAGTYAIKIRYGFSRLLMDNNPSATKLLSIDQWGTIQWQSFESAFKGCSNMTYKATDGPNLTQVTSFESMFEDCSVFNGDLSSWNVGAVTNMSHMFEGAKLFNGNIDNWDVREVTTMYFMFSWATAFNRNLNNWEVIKVKNMAGMFGDAHDFNQSLGEWDISSATNLFDMLDNSGMDTNNYNATLVGWANLATVPNTIWLGANGRVHCNEGTVARTFLENNKEWQFHDDSSCLEE